MTQTLAFHQATEVSGPPHADALNGARLIDQQTDDLNELRERIKCLLSALFIPLSCPFRMPLPFSGRRGSFAELLLVRGFLMGVTVTVMITIDRESVSDSAFILTDSKR